MPRLSAVVLLATAAALLLLLLGAAGAEADLIAAVDVKGPDGSLDLALVNAATGARSAIPATLATSADELHPTQDSTGQRLVFERVDPDAGTRRIVLTDPSTGREVDLFSVFDEAQFTPSLSQDGRIVTTGNALRPNQSGRFDGVYTTTDVSDFPTGSFARSQNPLFTGAASPGRVVQPTPERTLFGLQFDSGAAGQLVFRDLASIFQSSSLIAEPAVSLASPAAYRAVAGVVVFERATAATSGFGPAKLVFFLVGQTNAQLATALPQIVNAPGLDESHPAFDPDGRYLAFVRHGTDDHDRLFVLDTQTQTLLNTGGVDLGVPTNIRSVVLRRREGSVSLRVKPTILSSSIGSGNLIAFNIGVASKIGILVQRVVGKTRLLGKTVPKLRPVGAVPLGSFKKGRSSIRWNGKVNGKALKPGTYQVTPRSVAGGDVIREFGTPRTIRVR
jgi:WD40-like Beta Propeller Repeat